jgi:GNAT superfamily N-acetyltransferase
MVFQFLDPHNPDHISPIVTIWNAACGPDLAITPRFVEFNTRLSTGAVQAGRIAGKNGAPVGFVLASALPNDPDTSPPNVGWIDAIAVLPNAQRQGIGSALLAWAEEWLRDQGCTRARLGGSLRPFVAGYPVELGNAAFFTRRGYVERANSGEAWDVARDLSDYQGATHLGGASDLVLRPAQPGDEDALLQFLLREFPNRWRFEFQEFLRQNGRISDYMLLWTERGVDGFAHLTFEDSLCPIDRFYMHRLPRPWGQLGPIGVSADARGRGYGALLLDAALHHLRDRGVRGCVIDWTGLVDFYGRFGFKPYRRYELLTH